MKVKCIIKEGCNGKNYENFKFDEIRKLNKKTSDKLLKFGYAEKVGKNDEKPDTEDEKPDDEATIIIDDDKNENDGEKNDD